MSIEIPASTITIIEKQQSVCAAIMADVQSSDSCHSILGATAELRRAICNLEITVERAMKKARG